MNPTTWIRSILFGRHGTVAPCWRLVAVLVFGMVMGAAPASSFDTGPHFDMTEDAMAPMGFSQQSIRTVQAANFLVDFHEFMRKDILKEIKIEVRGVTIYERKILDPVCRAEMEKFLAIGDDSMHFDDLVTPTRVIRRWDAMLAATESVAKQKAKAGDILGLLALLGMSLHNVQDFYTHSNWVEQGFYHPSIGTGVLAPYGKHPTWLSVPRAIREKFNVHTQSPDKLPGRKHGDWNTDWKSGPSPTISMNKDWAGRRYYEEAYLCAYFATVQWTRLFRSYLADHPGVWDKMLRFQLKESFDPSRDWEYARRISFYGGHWNGNGGPTGIDALTSETAATSPQFLIESALGYMGGLCLTANRSALRLESQNLLETWATAKYQDPVDPPNLPKPDPEVAFAKLEVLRLDAIDTGDGSVSAVTKRLPGGLANELDWYARVRLGGQSYWSCLIDEHDNFNFLNPPYAPWTMIKALPTLAQDEALTSLTVTLRTGTDEGAGTDDDVEIWLGGSTRWLQIRDQDKHLENGANETFSVRVVPDVIGTQTVPLPYNVSDIRGISIRKQKNGKRGDWQLAGIELKANGRTIYTNPSVNVWFGDDNKSWTATDFTPQPVKSTSELPVVLRLMELDASDHKDDDHADINPNVGARDIGFLYSPATNQLRGDVNGPPAATVEGIGGKDKARLTFRVTKLMGISK